MAPSAARSVVPALRSLYVPPSVAAEGGRSERAKSSGASPRATHLRKCGVAAAAAAQGFSAGWTSPRSLAAAASRSARSALGVWTPSATERAQASRAITERNERALAESPLACHAHPVVGGTSATLYPVQGRAASLAGGYKPAGHKMRGYLAPSPTRTIAPSTASSPSSRLDVSA